MDLDLTSDQRDVALTFERVLAKESSIDRVRAAEAAGFDPALWKVLAEADAVGMAVPAHAGGGGSGLLEWCLVAEAVGRHLVCVPFVEASAAAMLLAEAGRVDLVPSALSAGEPVVLAPRPATDGVAELVPGGAAAGAVLALDGDELVLVRGPAVAPVGDLGFLGAADRRLRTETGREVIATGGRADELWQRALGWWRLGTAAACAGLAGQALAVAAEYARNREQFGVPIGSFQAVQHLLAGVAMAVDGALLLAREAAWRHDHGVGTWRGAADIAFAHAAETAVRSGEACLHVHGGYGYTLEYDAQLYLRRGKAALLQGGDPELLWESIGARVAGPRAEEAT